MRYLLEYKLKLFSSSTSLQKEHFKFNITISNVQYALNHELPQKAMLHTEINIPSYQECCDGK